MDGIPSWDTSYVRVNNASMALLNLLKKIIGSKMLQEDTNFELVKELLKLLTQGKSRKSSLAFCPILRSIMPSLSASLSLELSSERFPTSKKTSAIPAKSFGKRRSSANIDGLSSNCFLLLAYCSVQKCTSGGKSIENHGGNEADFIFRNEATSNVAIIEIKKPDIHLLGRPYRGQSYSLSLDVSGAVNQVLVTRIARNRAAQSPGKLTEQFEAFNPQCIVIVGCTKVVS